jgi:3-oxoacid CoA-transferase
MLPRKLKGFDGAMDLVSNPDQTKVVVTMEHVSKDGKVKILPQCEFPLTGKACISRIITDLCVFDVAWEIWLALIKIADGVTVNEVKQKIGAPFKVVYGLKAML